MSIGRIKIRPYQDTDFPRLCEIHDQARKDELALANLEKAFVPLKIAAKRENLFGYQIAVAEYDQQIAGFVAFTKEELAWLYVDPNLSGCGIGSKLVAYALQFLSRDAEIEVLKGNLPALRLYEKFGFKVKKRLSGVMPGNEQFRVTVNIMQR